MAFVTVPTSAFAGVNVANPQVPNTAAVQAPNETVTWCQRQIAAGAGGSGICRIYINGATPMCPTTVSTTGSIQCSPPQACEGSSCSGKDPAASGCASHASTNETQSYGTLPDGQQAYLYNRWSGACEANWTLVWVRGNWNEYLDAYLAYNGGNCGSGVNECFSAGYDQQYWADTTNELWTNMLDGSRGTNCTGSYDYPNGPNGYVYYTNCY